jgi:predicted phosphodiesterase
VRAGAAWPVVPGAVGGDAVSQTAAPEPGEDVDATAARFVVRVLTPDGRTAGVGVLVGPQHVLTCAHVVNVALGRADLRDQAPPVASDVVGLDFPLLTPASGGQADSAAAPAAAPTAVSTAAPTVAPTTASTRSRSPLSARVACWVPPPTLTTPGDDVAGLVLEPGSLPGGARPARLARTPPRIGRPVRVFGYPGTPPRPDGAWVQAQVQGRVGGDLLQVDVAAGSAVVIQPGFSGSPLVDEVTGRVAGLIATAPDGKSGQRDSRGLTVARLVSAWPQLLGSVHGPGRYGHPRGGPELTRSEPGRSELSWSEPGGGGQVAGRGTAAGAVTVLQVSDPQFGRNHTVFGGNGLTPADQAHDTLFARLHTDLARLEADQGLRPDLLVVTGDLAEWGLGSEFQKAFEFVGALADAVDLPRDRVVIVPGNHDVNRDACASYFSRQKADEADPVPPFWPKWEHFATAFTQFYTDVPGVSFTPDEPWTLFEVPDLSIVVAGLNSTMAESHRDTDHYGWLGEAQLRWFAERLAGYRRRGWLRLGAVHHNAVRGAVRDDENLRDVDQLDRLLGEPGLLHLLLHGHTHDGRLQRLSSGLIALATGSAAVAAEARRPARRGS